MIKNYLNIGRGQFKKIEKKTVYQSLVRAIFDNKEKYAYIYIPLKKSNKEYRQRYFFHQGVSDAI